MAEFSDFKPAKNESIEKKFIGPLPAIVFSGDESKQLVKVLVFSRNILDITFTNVPQQHVEDWLRSFHFDRLSGTGDVSSLPAGQFHLSHLDELHPEKNRSYSVSVTDPKKLLKTTDTASSGRRFP